MADVRVSRSLAVRAGVRWEKTANDAMEFDPRSKAEMLAAGFPLNTAGRATTIAGCQYQYQSEPRITRSEEYDNLFPLMAAATCMRTARRPHDVLTTYNQAPHQKLSR